MVVQWDRDLGIAELFHKDTLIARIFGCDSEDDADQRLRILGHRRRERWEQTAWGYQARVRRIEPSKIGDKS